MASGIVAGLTIGWISALPAKTSCSSHNRLCKKLHYASVLYYVVIEYRC